MMLTRIIPLPQSFSPLTRVQININTTSNRENEMTSFFFLSVLMFCFTYAQCYDFTNIPNPAMTQQPLGASPTNPSATELNSIYYNISSLGLPDPFAHYSTRVSYDSRVDIADPHNNQKGSVLSVLNGTVFPLGSVGSISAIGWDGGFNQTDAERRRSNSSENASSSESASNAKGALSGE